MPLLSTTCTGFARLILAPALCLGVTCDRAVRADNIEDLILNLIEVIDGGIDSTDRGKIRTVGLYEIKQVQLSDIHCVHVMSDLVLRAL